MQLGLVELLAMLVSAGGIVVVLILWCAQALYARFGKPPKTDVQRLFKDSDDSNHKD